MKQNTNEADLELLKNLNQLPHLKELVGRIVGIGLYEGSGCTTAAEAEMTLLEQTRGLGREALKQWAINGEIKAVEEARKSEETWKFEFNKKKILKWYSKFGEIEMEESFHRRRGQAEVRVFSPGAQIGHRKCSTPLQRAMVDFGSEHSFGRAARDLREHYGIEVPVSSIVRAGYRHGAQCAEFERQSGDEACGTLVCEMDGSMIPIVENEPGEGPRRDRRKHKETVWKEVKLSAVERQEDGTVGYAATMGCVEEAGRELYGLTLTAGATESTPIHGVGDGAVWIKDQFDDLFGDRSNYLIDFFHLCEYLAGAAPGCRPEKPESWIKVQQKRMKKNQMEKVLEELRKYLEPASTPRDRAPVRQCYDYINNRPDQFNYKEALEKELPIGSGLIESGHRHVIQQRLKISGAWWKKKNAQIMPNLRVLRANGAWDAYWESDFEKAA